MKLDTKLRMLNKSHSLSTLVLFVMVLHEIRKLYDVIEPL